MAEIEEGLEDQVQAEAIDDILTNVMQFTTYNVIENENDGPFYHFFTINDMANYIGNFSQKNLMEKGINSGTKNIIDVIEKDPLFLDQRIDREIIKIMKDDPKVNNMGGLTKKQIIW